ncbi:MAG: hypothetical protein LAO18_13425 [Acidobacteriia bacterium]|nr:hypothetical protein [Terriglobia bacterium]
MIAHISSALSGHGAFFIQGLVVIAVLAVGWYWPALGDSILRPVEEKGARLARRKTVVIVGMAAGTIVIRLSMLWLTPVPVPVAHDELSYLLAGDTLAHGRLTNPTHPMWIFLDTIHVNQQPVYMSKYPPGQGAALAFGQILGHPWIGVLLSMAAMGAAVVWMLQGWFPPVWAMLGGLLALLRFDLFNYWIDSYWGGAVAAIGGALVMGALPRIMHHGRRRDALLLGLGAAILANSRPVEGLLFCLPVGAVLGVWLFQHRDRWPAKLTNFIFPFSIVMLFTVGFIGYYNWRGTGSPFLFPYVVYQRAHFSSPPLLWQKADTSRHFVNPQFEAYSQEQLAEFESRREHFARTCWLRTSNFLGFYCGPMLAALVLTFRRLLRDRRMRLLLIQLLLSFLGLLAVAPFFLHYAAPLTATVFAVIIQGMRHLRKWRSAGRPVGIGLTRAIVLLALAAIPAHVAKTIVEARHGIGWSDPKMLERGRLAAQLEAAPGKHLVLVSNSSTHSPHEEWVYNAADIDDSKIVWAREIPGVDVKPLLEYFRGRTVWLLEPDRVPIQFTPYQPGPEMRPSPGP